MLFTTPSIRRTRHRGSPRRSSDNAGVVNGRGSTDNEHHETGVALAEGEPR